MSNLPIIIPLTDVCRDYFSHLAPQQLEKKLTAGMIKIPLVVIDPTSQKSAKGVRAEDLRKWIEQRHSEAARDLQQLVGRE